MARMTWPGPLVTLGIPAYNAERFIAKALDSLLQQTITDFELIVSDNASTDGTRDICEYYARQDRRVRYIRQPVNIGAPRNWNAIVHHARGAYFKWSSANDYCSPSMLEQCLNVLESEPRVVLCYGKTQLVDEHGNKIKDYEYDVSFDETRPSARFARVLELLSLNNLQCGVLRLDTLRKTRLDRMYPGGDMALTAELALYGQLRMIPEVLLFRRQSLTTQISMRTPLEQQKAYNPQATRAMKLIRTRWHADNFRSVARSPISLAEKLHALRIALKFVRWERGKIWNEISSLVTP